MSSNLINKILLEANFSANNVFLFAHPSEIPNFMQKNNKYKCVVIGIGFGGGASLNLPNVPDNVQVINLGTCGSNNRNIGEVITLSSKDVNHNSFNSTLTCVDMPISDYTNVDIVDMESFWITKKYNNPIFVKVVSDNRTQPFTTIEHWEQTAKKVMNSSLVQQKVLSLV